MHDLLVHHFELSCSVGNDCSTDASSSGRVSLSGLLNRSPILFSIQVTGRLNRVCLLLQTLILLAAVSLEQMINPAPTVIAKVPPGMGVTMEISPSSNKIAPAMIAKVRTF